ncbi:hypothetical protein PC116_g8278 [Phytophthora cactorum]|nr:hypothetical protein C6341_g8754 [Phytophthora cactorum]KAG4047365.1 hypothetical protein PC123_g17277 [Phytophthora cactorum]KAG4243870.1 hypothetical protein PC116_g8278 [Phytophthora cactorum]
MGWTHHWMVGSEIALFVGHLLNSLFPQQLDNWYHYIAGSVIAILGWDSAGLPLDEIHELHEVKQEEPSPFTVCSSRHRRLPRTATILAHDESKRLHC